MNARDKRQLLALLRRFLADSGVPRRIPAAVFDTLLHLTPQVTIETVIVRQHGGRTNVLLTRRSPRESRYPNIWHAPGSFIRYRERTQDTLGRIARHELGLAGFASATFVTWRNIPSSPVGHFLSLVFRCTIRRRPARGRWFAVNALPPSVLPYQRQIIAAALASS